MKNRDILLDCYVLFLGLLGLFCLFSVSFYYFLYQSAFFAIAVILYFLTSTYLTRSVTTFVNVLYIVILLSLIFLYLFGVATRGSASWISFGIVNFQPSEFAKIATVFYTAYFLNKTNFFTKKLIKLLAVIVPVILLVFLQPDFGNFFVLCFSVIFVIFTGFLSFKKFVLLTIISSFLLVTAYFFILQDYQKNRITSFFGQTSDEKSTNYNLDQSKIAIGSGGIFGKGMRKNTQVILNFLPEPHTDFIFSAVLEIYGIVFGFVLLTFFIIFTYYIFYKYILRASSSFGMLYASGVLSIYVIQLVLNLGMTVGLLPITGLTLPFISYGGSSLISLYILFGFLQGLNTKNT